MKILGLTGGIGSGKSVVSELFRMMGIPVYDSDDRSKKICDTDSVLKNAIIELFGTDMYAEGLLNRKALAQHIFADEKALRAVNALIHPFVEKDFIEWVQENNQHPILVQESAILFEAGLENNFDRIICVTAPESLRIERVSKRNGVSPESVRERIKSQMAESEKIAKSDIVVINDGFQALLPQVLKIVQSQSL